MSSLIRPIQKSDYAAVVALRNAVDPDGWPTNLERFTYHQENRNPELYHASFVLEHEGQIIGQAETGHDDFAFEEGKFDVRVQVHPDFQCQGFGRKLYAHVLEHLEPMQPKLLQAFITERLPAGKQFVEREGFTATWKRYESKLETHGFDFAPYQELENRVRASGIQIKSLAELEHDPEANRKLWELDWTLFQDIPMGVTFTKVPFEHWVKDELESPGFLKEACLIAIDPARHDDLLGSFVGYTCLIHNPAGFHVIGMTGLLREYRGRGIAKALKLGTMRYVQSHGGSEIRTANDPPNQAMLRMNMELGFERMPSNWRYQKALDGRTLEAFDESKYQ